MQLFAPNNLSVRTPHFEPVEDANRREQVHNLWLANYARGQGPIRDLLEHEGPGIISSNYVVILDNGKGFLKCRYGLESGPRLKWETDLADRLSIDVPVARPITNDSGACVTRANGNSWALFEFYEGDYFAGTLGELESAGLTFAAMVKALESVPGAGLFKSQLDLGQLSQLVDEAASDTSVNSAVSELCRANRSIIDASCQDVWLRRDVIESVAGLVHLDFHPLNLLFANGKLACILDFEDVVVYPTLAALGFGCYKLVRQMMVDPAVRGRELRSPALAGIWLEQWHQVFPDSDYRLSDLGCGAKYRLLDLIDKILFASLRQNDSRYEYDLAKQIGALYEADFIFKKDSDRLVEPKQYGNASSYVV